MKRLPSFRQDTITTKASCMGGWMDGWMDGVVIHEEKQDF